MDDVRKKLQQQYCYFLANKTCGEFGSAHQHERNSIYKLCSQFLQNAHEHVKFRQAEITQIIRMSATASSKFSGAKAAKCFEGFELLAVNLLLYPWREEYNEIKAWTRFWRLEVIPTMSDFEILLRVIGYSPIASAEADISSTRWRIGTRASNDLLLNVAFDCFLAQIECTAFQDIYDTVRVEASFDVPWIQIVECRFTVGCTKTCVHVLLHNSSIRNALHSAQGQIALGAEKDLMNFDQALRVQSSDSENGLVDQGSPHSSTTSLAAHSARFTNDRDAADSQQHGHIGARARLKHLGTDIANLSKKAFSNIKHVTHNYSYDLDGYDKPFIHTAATGEASPYSVTPKRCNKCQMELRQPTILCPHCDRLCER